MKGRRGRPRGPSKPYTVVLEDYETVCRICEAEFLDEEDLKMHIEQMHLSKSSGRMLCKVCHVVLPGADLFASHFIVKHLEDSIFCFYCYRIFSDPVLLDQHELKHRAVADDAAVSCSQCSIILPDRYKLQDHEYKEHSNSQDGILLNCFFPLLSAGLNMNVKKFIDCICKKMPFVCTCKHTTFSLNEYITHLITLNCTCVVCDKCCNVYKMKHSIITHISKNPQCQNYVDKVIVKKPCPKCDLYINSTEFNVHVDSCNILKCSTCDKQFTSIHELTEHRVTEHVAKISLITCKICQKQFVGKLTLQKHIDRTHKNKTQYKYNCVYCGSVFPHPRRLFAHFFTKHKNIQPYTCAICNQQFRLRKHFTFHIKLRHNSVGYVEFDKNLHVIFTDNKSKNPVSPKANLDLDSSTDASDIDSNGKPRKKLLVRRQRKSKTNNTKESTDQSSTIKTDPDKDKDVSKVEGTIIEPFHIVDVEVERLDESETRNLRSRTKKLETMSVNSPEELTDDSEEEPLSNIRESLLREKTLNKKTMNNQKAKLTCKICKKYCYTVQYYHHHLTLHEKSKMKRCIKCNKYFKTRQLLKSHIDSTHTSSKLIETLKSVMEKRKKIQPVKQAKPDARPGESLKYVLEKRKKQQVVANHNSISSRFRQTIQKVDINDQSTATITPLSEHGLSVKNFIENFKPEGDSVSISNSVTLKAISAPVTKEPIIKMRPFTPSQPEPFTMLRFPVKFKDTGGPETKISVKLVQQLVTKPKAVNMVYNERVPVTEEKTESDEYCNMFADETDYTQYKNDGIPEVAQEVMLGDPEDIPRTKRLAREIYIPKISDEHGGVRIGHLLPEAPFYKIVKVKKLLDAVQDQEPRPPPPPVIDNDVKLPDGTRLISVKNPYAHLIANEHLEEILKANRTKYYKPKTKNIGKAIAKALNPVRPVRKTRSKKVD